jgi:flagellar biosynthesis protein FliQ
MSSSNLVLYCKVLVTPFIVAVALYKSVINAKSTTFLLIPKLISLVVSLYVFPAVCVSAVIANLPKTVPSPFSVINVDTDVPSYVYSNEIPPFDCPADIVLNFEL